MKGIERLKDKAIAANAFAVSSFPTFSPEGFHVAPKGIFAHLAKMREYQLLAVLGDSLKMPFGFLCQSDGPSHVRAVPK